MTEVDEHPKTPVVVRELINKDKKQKKGVMRDIAILLLSMKTWLSWCYVAAPVCYYYYFSGGSAGVQFWSAFVAMIPMATLLGDLTEVLAAHTGDLIGGLVNATLGNAVEMIITVQCLRKGLLQIVTGQLIGSILSNLLLVLGCSFLCGGVVHYVQRFSAYGPNIVGNGLPSGRCFDFITFSCSSYWGHLRFVSTFSIGYSSRPIQRVRERGKER